MSEPVGIYTVKPSILYSKSELRSRPCSLPYSDPDYQDPTPREVQSLFSIAGWTQNEAADHLGVSSNASGSITIRRWKSVCSDYKYPDRKKRANSMPYSAWRLALILSGVVNANA